MTKGNGQHDPQIASLDEARQRAAEKAKAEKRKSVVSAGGSRTVRDLLIGGLLIAMALGYIASLVMPAANSPAIQRMEKPAEATK